jgi:predicted MPP superfamily phosphohydrolase
VYVVAWVIFSFVLVTLYLSQRYWLRLAWRRLDRITSPAARRALRALLFLFLALLVTTLAERFFGRFLPRPFPGASIIIVAQLWLLPSAVAYLLIKLVHAVSFAWRRLSPPAPEADLPRRRFLRYAAGAAGALPLATAFYGFAQVRLRYRIHEVEVPIAGLPPALDGLRIAQLSDIHAGDFMPPDEIASVAQRVNRLDPHLTVLTGDFVTGPADPLEDAIAALGRLRAPLGVFGCNGNHEIYAQADHRTPALFAHSGMTLLRQENAVLDYRGARFNLIGVDYQRTPRDMHSRGVAPGPMLEVIEPLVRRDMPNLLLTHNPNAFPRAAELGIELSLAGHTHGGQIKVEILDRWVSPARFITPFIAGLYSRPGAHGAGPSYVYVNRGLGTIALPVRLGADPEITLLTLRSA